MSQVFPFVKPQTFKRVAEAELFMALKFCRSRSMLQISCLICLSHSAKVICVFSCSYLSFTVGMLDLNHYIQQQVNK